MKRLVKRIAYSLSFILFIIIAIGLFLFSQTEDFIVLKVKFKSCPYNHYSLKAVPISYGFIIPDSSYLRRFKNYELFPGGCVVSKDSPKYRVVCTKCNYILEKSDSGEYWLRRDSLTTDFEIKLNTIISRAPIINLFTFERSSSLIYFQQYNNGKVLTETVTYQTKSKIADLEQEFIKYFNLISLEITEVDLTKENYYDYYQYIKSYKATRENKEFELTISKERGADIKRVTLLWQIIN